MVIPQKLRDKVRLKYRFTRLDKYFSTYTKGDRRFTLSGTLSGKELAFMFVPAVIILLFL